MGGLLFHRSRAGRQGLGGNQQWRQLPEFAAADVELHLPAAIGVELLMTHLCQAKDLRAQAPVATGQVQALV